MDEMPLDPSSNEPARQPEAVTASLIGQRDPADRPASTHRLASPPLDQSQQCCRIRFQLLQRLALNAGNSAAHQPLRLAHLQDTDTMLDIRSLRRRSIIASTPMREWLCLLPRARFIATSSSYSWICQTARWRSQSGWHDPRRQLSACGARHWSLFNICANYESRSIAF